MGSNRKRTLVEYALVVVGSLILVMSAYLAASHNLPSDSYRKWLGFVISTLGGFAVIIKDTRRFWHTNRFWVFLGGIFLLHTMIFSLILRQVEFRWGFAPFLVIFLFEVPLLTKLLGWAQRHFEKSHRSA
jgi:hypothetical protein